MWVQQHALPKICLTGRRSVELHIEVGGLSALLATDDVNPELFLGQSEGDDFYFEVGMCLIVFAWSLLSCHFECHNSCQVWMCCCRALKHLSNRTKEHLAQ